jgi:hypothetical protein
MLNSITLDTSGVWAPANGVVACASVIAVITIETVVKIAMVRLAVACY